MKSRNGRRYFAEHVVTLASLALVTSGCAGLPSVEGVTNMSLGTDGGPRTGPRASITGESDAGPGKAVMEVLPAAEACQDILILACIVILPIAIPIAAIVGSVAKVTQKLPQEQAVELNRVTAGAVSQINLPAGFSAALAAEAMRRGIALNPANSSAAVFVSLPSLEWDIKGGNRVALRMEIDVRLRHAGEQGSTTITHRGRPARVEDWIADDGEPIRAAFQEAMHSVSQQAWERVLGVERRRSYSP